jgi:hypothetical protein
MVRAVYGPLSNNPNITDRTKVHWGVKKPGPRCSKVYALDITKCGPSATMQILHEYLIHSQLIKDDDNSINLQLMLFEPEIDEVARVYNVLKMCQTNVLINPGKH